MTRAFLDVMLPDTNNTITAGRHVGVLGIVKAHSTALPRTWLWKPLGIAMPVIAVELDHQIETGHEGVNTELVSNQPLTLIGYAKSVKQAITQEFKVVGVHCELLCVHATQLHFAVRISIAASKRTVEDIVMLVARWRPHEYFAAYLAGVARLVASLPGIRVGNTTEVGVGLFKTIVRKIERFSAQLTSALLPILALRPTGAAIAGKGTIALSWAQSLRGDLATPGTSDCANSILIHDSIVSHNGGIVKPMGLMRYA